ncbi:MAG: hypothetical protein HY690_17340 [Chloroflexi bacterium]|nr:hypothetical protein [Chloroflexota bacterium]
MSEPQGREVQAEMDRFLKASTDGLAAEEAAYVLAVLLNRGAAELTRLARAVAAERKGNPDWGRWAALHNTARALVLQASTARDVAAQLAGRPR